MTQVYSNIQTILLIHPYVFLNPKKDAGLIYNTLNGKYIKYRNSDFSKLLRRNIFSSYTFKLTSKDIKSKEVEHIIKEIEQLQMGYLIQLPHNGVPPLQIPPILNIQSEHDKGTNEQTLNYNLFNSLYEVTIYLNSTEHNESHIYNDAFKQFHSILSNHKNKVFLNNKEILEFLKGPLQQDNISYINLSGGDVLAYKSLTSLHNSLKKYNILIKYMIDWEKVSGNFEILESLSGKATIFNFFMKPPFDNDLNNYNNITKLNQDVLKNSKFTFIVESKVDYKMMEQLVSEHAIANYNAMPYFNKKNYVFFRNEVFLEEGDIVSKKQPIVELCSNNIINRNFYGKLSILNNGAVYGNLNSKKLGDIYKNSIIEILQQEMGLRSSWHKTRRKVDPCKSCIYNSLCPPISNYEYIFKKYNLCNIHS